MIIEKFPFIEAEGDNFQVGLAIGGQLKKQIGEYLAEQREQLGDRFEKVIAESTVSLAQVTIKYHKYIEELEGIAAGAQVPFIELFLANNREISGLGPPQPTRCTIIGIPTVDGYLIGHNEDWLPNKEKYLFMLDVKINGVRITGLSYCYELVGGSIAINNFGLIQAVNELLHYEGGGKPSGIPKNFIARAILDCRSLEQAESIIETIPRAGGFNHVLVQDKRLWNFETSARKFSVQKIRDMGYAHTNHYITEELRGLDRGTQESRERLTKVQSRLSKIKDTADIMELLSDRENPPICRENTNGSVIIDVRNKIIYVAYGQPTPEGYYQIEI